MDSKTNAEAIQQAKAEIRALRARLLRDGMPRYKTYSWYLLAHLDTAVRSLNKAEEVLSTAERNRLVDRMPRINDDQYFGTGRDIRE